MIDYILFPILAFFSAVVADIVWVHWALNVHARNPHRAALFSVGIILCGSVLTLALIQENRLAYIAGLLGAYFGTYLAVVYEKTND